jgi:hypothetical protein
LVPNEKVAVVADDSDETFGILASVFHHLWVLEWGATMGETLVYDPRALYETFPQSSASPAVERAGRALDMHRTDLMMKKDEGLTKVCNGVHDPVDRSLGMIELRELHRSLDIAVRDAYGWSDLDLDHGFFETAQGRRFTIGPTACTEVLKRLLEVNHQRYAGEVAAGLHDKRVKKPAKRRSTREQTLL